MALFHCPAWITMTTVLPSAWLLAHDFDVAGCDRGQRRDRKRHRLQPAVAGGNAAKPRSTIDPYCAGGKARPAVHGSYPWRRASVDQPAWRDADEAGKGQRILGRDARSHRARHAARDAGLRIEELRRTPVADRDNARSTSRGTGFRRSAPIRPGATSAPNTEAASAAEVRPTISLLSNFSVILFPFAKMKSTPSASTTG